jgi:NADP-dependent 3-hydroxy acid dehydrogenase YdfG
MLETQFNSELVNIAGKSVIISGGTTGIGRATAVLLASRQARVLIFGREQTPLNDALNVIKSKGNEAIGLTADVSKKEDIEQVFETADQKLGGVDILINNAALGAGTIDEMHMADQEYIVRTNLLGYMYMTHEAIQRMKIKGEGQIIFIGSMSADVHEAGSSVYVATKSGILGLTQALRKEVYKMGIRVSIIEPGETGSDMNPLTVEEQRQRQANLEQLKAEDVADAVYYVLTRPKRSDIIELKIRPHMQPI